VRITRRRAAQAVAILQTAFAGALQITELQAQTAPISPSEPEVRRAIPVGLSAATPTPSVMRALPAQTLPPAQAAGAPQPQTSPVDAEGSIRMAPATAADPAVLQLSVADGFYARKQAESAVPEYEKFLVMATAATQGRERALYRLGESQRMMGSNAAAERTFLRLTSEYPSGAFAPSAFFRLGELREILGQYPNAADNFAAAAKGAADPAIRITALYRQALCLEKNKQQAQADALFEAVASENPSSPGGNPYRLPTLMHLAANAAAAGKKELALGYYDRVIATNTSGEILGEAALKAALLQSELGKPEEAKKLFAKVAASKDSGHWRSMAQLGLLRMAAQSGDENAILKVAESATAIDQENRAELLLLQATALRKTGKSARALEFYDQVMREFPGSKEAAQAPFQRLLALHSAKSPSLLEEIDQYLLTAADPSERAKAQLLKAEETLRLGKYKEAAALYHDLSSDALPTESKPDILYKEAWALVQSGDQVQATEALTRFLNAYPSDNRSPAALAQRALLKQQQKDFAGALADYTQLQEKYPVAAERELALQQKGLLLGQQQQNKEMAETFNLLLRDYPKSSAAPQAHYWIGWSALENKDFATAITELRQARAGDSKQFGERAGLRLLLAEYYQGHLAEAVREASALKPSLVPPEVGHWIGLKAMESGDPVNAEHFLKPLVASGMPGAMDPEIQATLASALIAQGKYRDAVNPAAASLKMAMDPASRAKALLVSADIQRALKNIPQASSMIDEAMLLQPEGPINAEARILNGDLLVLKKEDAAAAKAYMTVAVLYDDPLLTPKALARAAEAYRRSGNEADADKTLAELHKRFPNAEVPKAPRS
jgi:TolA-binding protein